MSFFLDPYLPILAYLAVWGVLVLLGYLLKAEKHGIILKPYYFMLKTVVFNSWLERIGNRFRRIWLVYFDIGAAMGLGLLVFAITIFLQNAVGLLTRAPSAGPTLLIVPLPGLTIGWDVFPYVLISIAILLIPHEAAHGIASVLDKVPIKSSGVFMAVFLPGGFVEIDEEDLAKRASKTKLRVFAAGSSTNVISWLLVVLLLSNFALTISPLYNASPSGVLVTRLSDGGPAQTAGIQPWSVITSLDNTTVNRVGDLANYLARVRPNATVVIGLNDARKIPVLTKPASDNASRALIGIQPFDYYAPRAGFLSVAFPFQLFSTFQWLAIILLGVGIVNMLPMYPFDGDRYFDTILGRLGLKDTRKARTLASIISLSLLGGNLVLSYIMFGTVFPR
ncbi:hypothetical protein AUG19_05140 [archaeon 13_1_20CM_2_54_9]|nr:MAG: hypothetical protein AUJ07_11730 [Crenarchaeota archaeon 13_1_40CM_3_53_5]OLE75582.1 MAG: hypothetical protein AUG19_05140 [archaeon 13_1_20CM_2_54_9]TMI31081.1 MAG: PDZ domain-containing protein [Candidatus Bathyarchaeota archaeon]